MKILKPNKNNIEEVAEATKGKLSIFLGGSIEQGKAVDWQTSVTWRFRQVDDLIFLNPRRDSWDSSWEQDPTPGTKFYEQVQWEMIAQELSDINIYYFDPNTKSPITLLELGGFSDKKSLVYCPKDFWRYGNVKMFCDMRGIFVTENRGNFFNALSTTISKHIRK